MCICSIQSFSNNIWRTSIEKKRQIYWKYWKLLLSLYFKYDPLIELQFWENTARSNMKILAVIFALVALAGGFKIGTKKALLIKLAKSIQCGPDETTCPGGCCPEANWFCCPDAYYCAATAADCPFEAKRTQLMELAKSSQCDGVWCPNGLCCHYPGGSCCENLCSPVPFECP